jgi:hypothetical protein
MMICISYGELWSGFCGGGFRLMFVGKRLMS